MEQLVVWTRSSFDSWLGASALIGVQLQHRMGPCQGLLQRERLTRGSHRRGGVAERFRGTGMAFSGIRLDAVLLDCRTWARESRQRLTGALSG